MSVGKYALSCDSICGKAGQAALISKAHAFPVLESYSSSVLASGTTYTMNVTGYRDGGVFVVTSLVCPTTDITVEYPAPLGMPVPPTSACFPIHIYYPSNQSGATTCLRLSTSGTYRFTITFWGIDAVLPPISFMYYFE